mgnify:FL=1
MFKKFKKIILLLAVIIVSFVCVKAFAVPSPSKEFYVNDFAEILSDETEQYILSNSAALCEKTKAQIAVVTVKNLEGKEIAEYALELFRSWGIGDKELNNGILILLSLEERKVRIEVGDGLEGRVNDSKAGRFLDTYAVPHFKSDEWDEGIKALYSAILSEVYQEYDLEVPSDVEQIVKDAEPEEDTAGMIAAVIILVVVFGFAIIPFGKSDGNSRDDGYGGGGFYSGGSSGGFGGFSGGGGSSSGGGASRGF